MSHRVELTEALLEDLFHLYRWIVLEASEAVADAYLDRVHERLASLREFPNRGTPRDDIGPQVRSLTFERRMLLLYRVEGAVVTVLRAINGARDVPRAYDG